MHEASIFYLRGINMKHSSVLLNECIEGLNIKEDGIYVDATLGGGGHSGEILKRLNPLLETSSKQYRYYIPSSPIFKSTVLIS